MVLHVKAGNGGSGAVSFATGKYIRTAPAGNNLLSFIHIHALSSLLLSSPSLYPLSYKVNKMVEMEVEEEM